MFFFYKSTRGPANRYSRERKSRSEFKRKSTEHFQTESLITVAVGYVLLLFLVLRCVQVVLRIEKNDLHVTVYIISSCNLI